MSGARVHREQREEDERPERAPAPTPPEVTDVLGLQAAAGNQAVARLLARQPAPGPTTAPAPGTADPAPAPAAPPLIAGRTPEQFDYLVKDIRKAVAQHETGEVAHESRIPTSAGVHASLASQVQATVGWAVTALRLLDDTALAQFGLSRTLLGQAETVNNAVDTLWSAVMASPAATTAATFAAANTAMLTATHLNQTHLERMFRFRDLRNECRRALRDDVPPLITQLEALSDADLLARSNARDRKAAGISTNSLDNVAAPQKASLRAAIARRETLQRIANTNADAQFFGMTYLNALDAYTRGGGAWREDLAAWQRVALREMQTNLQTVPGGQFPGNVGQRVENAATEDEGLWLAYKRFSQRAREYLENPAHAGATDQQVCQYVAGRHNPGNRDYDDRVVLHFRAIRGTANLQCPQHGRLAPGGTAVPPPPPPPRHIMPPPPKPRDAFTDQSAIAMADEGEASADRTSASGLA